MFKHNKNPLVKPNFRKISQLSEEEVSTDENIREVIVEHKSGFNTLEVLIIVIVSIAFGIVVGCSLSIFRNKYQDVKVSKPLKEMIAVYQNILDTYYEDVDGSDLADAAIDGMISSLDDPYSVYMDEDDSDVFNTTVDGSYVGIGVTVAASDTSDFIVIGILDNSPAQKAGIEVGDVITEIDSKSVIGLTLDDISSLIKGKVGTKVKLTLLRGEKTLEKTVTRGNVELISRTEDNEIGKKIEVKGGTVTNFEDAGCPKGSTITVTDLFYNTPVRYKFLKKDFTEAGYIEDAVTRIALVHPEIAIKLINSGKVIIQTSGNGDMQSVIYSIYGKDVAENIGVFHRTRFSQRRIQKIGLCKLS